jgi:energy-coupling factor transporter transmembrane protein EcfT
MFWEKPDVHTKVWLVFLIVLFSVMLFSAITKSVEPIYPVLVAFAVVLTLLFGYKVVATQMTGILLFLLSFLVISFFNSPIGFKKCDVLCIESTFSGWLFHNLTQIAIYSPIILLFSVLFWLVSSEIAKGMTKEQVTLVRKTARR